jgi:glycosyltransferase involved in cell wall biosynthesis
MERTMKVVISAYSCEPGAGSEPGAGWTWSRAAARAGYEVFLVTRRNNRDPIESALAAEPDLAITPVYVELSDRMLRWKRGHKRARSYYVLWQHAARRRMARLHDEVRFDVAHHLTFAVDWLPAAAVELAGVPAVWGPVGGAGRVPLRAYRWLGLRGALQEVAREVPIRMVRAVVGTRMARRSALTVAQNDDVAHRFRLSAETVVVEPNVALKSGAVDALEDRGLHPSIVFAARLVPWKGLALAIATLAELPDQWTLRVVGDGPERRRGERLALSRSIQDRVVFLGQVSRDIAVSEISSADVMLLPSMHDSAGWVVGEAVQVSTPVVCLDLGGPATMVRRSSGTAVQVRRDLPRALANAVVDAHKCRQRADPAAWSDERLPALVDAWYRAAVQRR